MPEIRRSNSKAFAQLNTRLKELDGYQTKVGWFETARYEDGTPVAYIAAIQELGSEQRSIPPRPFMRPTVIEKEEAWKSTAAAGARRVVAGKATGAQMMDLIGAQAEGDVHKKIESITAPPLSPITLGARKYRQQGKKVTGATIGEIAAKLKAGTLDISGVPDKPLDDTHTMIENLTHVTERSQ